MRPTYSRQAYVTVFWPIGSLVMLSSLLVWLAQVQLVRTRRQDGSEQGLLQRQADLRGQEDILRAESGAEARRAHGHAGAHAD